MRELTVHTVSVRPRVFEVPQFLSDAECEHLIDLIRSSELERSKVGGDTGTGGDYRDVRTRFVCLRFARLIFTYLFARK